MWRQIILFFVICLIGTPGFYVYDAMAVIGPYLLKDGYTELQISWLYSCYYYPNIIFSLLAGICVDRIGVNSSSCLFSITTVIGAGIMYSFENIIGLTIGRIILGISAEAIFVCQIKWFILFFQSRLTLTLALSLVYNRLASWLCYITLPYIANVSVSMALLSCLCICITTLIINLIFVKCLKSSTEHKLNNSAIRAAFLYCFKSPKFCLLFGLTFCYYGAIMSYNALAPTIIVILYNVSPERANHIASFLTLGSMILTPFIGWLTDKYQKLNLWLALGLLFAVIPISCLIADLDIPIILATLLLGFSFGIVPCLIYRSISLFIPTDFSGIATGLIEASTSLAVVIFPLSFSWLFKYTTFSLALTLILVLLTLGYFINLALGLTIFLRPEVEPIDHVHPDYQLIP